MALRRRGLRWQKNQGWTRRDLKNLPNTNNVLSFLVQVGIVLAAIGFA